MRRGRPLTRTFVIREAVSARRTVASTGILRCSISLTHAALEAHGVPRSRNLLVTKDGLNKADNGCLQALTILLFSTAKRGCRIKGTSRTARPAREARSMRGAENWKEMENTSHATSSPSSTT